MHLYPSKAQADEDIEQDGQDEAGEGAAKEKNEERRTKKTTTERRKK
jgi:hypothetical protein